MEENMHQGWIACKEAENAVENLFALKFILFQKSLKYDNTVNIYYTTQFLKLQARVSTWVIWAVTRTITETLNSIINNTF